MLLYIGDRGDMRCLQEISDKLKQAICLFSAPKDPEELIKLTGPQYSHYLVDIACYEGRHKELIRALKKFVGVIDGQLILLAVDMTTDHQVISELIYAGFTNIIFGHSENSTAVNLMDNKCPSMSHSKEQSYTLPLVEDVSATQSLTTEPMEMYYRELSSIKEPGRETELMSVAPYPGREIEPVSKERAEPAQSIKERGRYRWKIPVLSGCILTILVVFAFCYQKIALKKPDTMYTSKEQYLEGKAVAKVTVRPDECKPTVRPEVPESTPAPLTTTAAQMLEPAITEAKSAEPYETESSGTGPIKTEPKETEPKETEPKETEPKETEPKETEPLETGPIETEPPMVAEPVKKEEKKEVKEEKKSNQENTVKGKKQQRRIPIKRIFLPSSIRMVTGKSLYLEVKYTPSNAGNHRFLWKSSDSSIATVKNGRVYAKKPGKVRITVTSDNGKKAVCNITIARQ